MAVSLTKGANVTLDKGLTKMRVGLGWDARATDGEKFDLDASCFMLKSDGHVRSEKDYIFYGNLKSACGSVVHMGDNLTGEGDGDDEVIQVDLAKVPEDVARLAFVVTIYDAAARKQNFGQVQNAFVRLVDDVKNQEEARYDLSEDYSTVTSMIFAELYRKDGNWKFKAIGQGVESGIVGIGKMFGIEFS